MPRPVRASLVVAALLMVPGAARAQARPAAVVPAREAAARGDTTGAHALLDSAIARDPRDAAAWHLRGRLLWEQARRGRTERRFDTQVNRTLERAEAALRMAAHLAPDSTRYALVLGEFLEQSPWKQSNGLGQREKARLLQAAIVEDRSLDAASVASLTHTVWQQYEAWSHVALQPPDWRYDIFALDAVNARPFALRDVMQQHFRRVGPRAPIGEMNQLRLEELLSRGLVPEEGGDPGNRALRRLEYRYLIDTRRWDELRASALAHLRARPDEPTAHAALGLALQRLEEPAQAEPALARWLALLPEAKRARLTRLSRVMRPERSERGRGDAGRAYDVADAAERARIDSVYWAFADPLALTPENEYRTEFLARLAEAELRWRQDGDDSTGADGTVGDLLVRLGPPQRRDAIRVDGRRQGEVWQYRDGLALALMQRRPAVMILGPVSSQRAELVREHSPTTWDNVPLTRRIDTVQVQVARFRAGGARTDSADVFVAAALPLDSLRRGVDVRRLTLDVGLGFWSPTGVARLRDSTRVQVDAGEDAVNLARMRAWTRRLAAGEHVYRVEAVQVDAARGARARALVDVRADTGFGTSDLLVAAGVVPRPGTAPLRWRDLALAPSTGTFARGAPIALAWETYDLAADSTGAARCEVAVSLQRRVENKLLSFALRMIGSSTGSVGVRTHTDRDRRVRYQRATAASPATVDWLTLDVGKLAAGEYAVTVEVTDLVGTRMTTATRRIVVR